VEWRPAAVGAGGPAGDGCEIVELKPRVKDGGLQPSLFDEHNLALRSSSLPGSFLTSPW